MAHAAFTAPLPVSGPAGRYARSQNEILCERQPPVERTGPGLCARASLDEKSQQPDAKSRLAAALAAGLLAFSPAVDAIRQTPVDALAARGGGDTFFSASGNVIKDGESLLRWSLPIQNRPVRELQASLEAAISDTRGLKWGRIDGDLRKAKAVLKNKSDQILASVPTDRVDEAKYLLTKLSDAMPMLTEVAGEQKVEKFISADRGVLRDVGRLEELMVSGFPYEVPDEYEKLPQLLGRATIDIVVRKDGDEPFDIDGTLYKQGNMTIVVDGYSAPISGGSFVELVSKGFYNGLPIIRSDGFIIQSGKPAKGEGVPGPDGSMRRIPLEVFAKGDAMPLYGMTLEEDGRGTAATVLPFSSFGTLAMAREEFEPNTASSQFFWFLFEPDLTPAGRNLMDGSWGVFGYTIKGEKFLRGLQRGDRIVSAKVVSGLENLKPGESPPPAVVADDNTRGVFYPPL